MGGCGKSRRGRFYNSLHILPTPPPTSNRAEEKRPERAGFGLSGRGDSPSELEVRQQMVLKKPDLWR